MKSVVEPGQLPGERATWRLSNATNFSASCPMSADGGQFVPQLVRAAWKANPRPPLSHREAFWDSTSLTEPPI